MKRFKRVVLWVRRKGVAIGMTGIGLVLGTVAIQDFPVLGKFFAGKFPELNGIAYATFTPPTIETENILLIAGAVFTAIAAIWFVKKGIKLLNRS
jgi:hypothetical protein